MTYQYLIVIGDSNIGPFADKVLSEVGLLIRIFTPLSARSDGWFISLLVHLCEEEILLAGLDEQYFCERTGQPSPSQPAQRTRSILLKNMTCITSFVMRIVLDNMIIMRGITLSSSGTSGHTG